MSKEDYHKARDYIRAALTATRLVAGRDIVFREDGITVTDPNNGKHHFTATETPPSRENFEQALNGGYGYFSYSRDREVKFSGHGSWQVTEKGGTFILKAAKKRNAALEALTTANADELAMLRSLYDLPNVDIIVACEGEARTKDIALAFAAELHLSGHNTTLYLEPEYERSRVTGFAEDAEEQDGPPIFGNFPKAGQEWSVRMVGNVKSFLEGSQPSGVSRIIVHEDEHMAARFGRATAGAFAPSRRPAVLVGIALKDSTPVATIVFSTAALALANANATAHNAPWTIYNERKAARLKSRPPVTKTWHRTTDQVARAFIAREAPRGYVSGKSLYFHGPVAFSVYDRNPVAALVDVRNGKTVMFTGRNSGLGGTLAGTVTGATGDIHTASKNSGFIVFHVGELTDFLTFGDLQLDDMAGMLRRKKNEADYPNSCKVDAAKLEKYILSRRKAAEEELAHLTRKSAVATYTKAGCWAALERIALFRDAMIAHLGIELPDMGDAREFATKREEESKAARLRQDGLRTKRAALEAEEAERMEEGRGLYVDNQNQAIQLRR